MLRRCLEFFRSPRERNAREGRYAGKTGTERHLLDRSPFAVMLDDTMTQTVQRMTLSPVGRKVISLVRGGPLPVILCPCCAADVQLWMAYTEVTCADCGCLFRAVPPQGSAERQSHARYRELRDAYFKLAEIDLTELGAERDEVIEQRRVACREWREAKARLFFASKVLRSGRMT